MKVRIVYPHPRFGQHAEAIGRSLFGTRPVRFEDGVCGVLEPHEWRAA